MLSSFLESSLLTKEIILTHVEDENNNVHVVEVVATVLDAEEPDSPVQSAVVEVQVAAVVQIFGKLNDDVAATKIQTAFRGYIARQSLWALRALVRLKSLLEGPVVKRQAISTLRSMLNFAHLQSQIHSRRLRMLDESQALKKHLLQKHTKELESMREWDESLQSKEQIEAKLLSKYEAVTRRERALAYSYSQRGRKASIPSTLYQRYRNGNVLYPLPSMKNWHLIKK
ncbi:hypothetical protein Lal_00037613 [Lupinus albus]|nr:hypothetical protein Lal_00037613 [Lupinus albus]